MRLPPFIYPFIEQEDFMICDYYLTFSNSLVLI